MLVAGQGGEQADEIGQGEVGMLRLQMDGNYAPFTQAIQARYMGAGQGFSTETVDNDHQ